VTSTDELTELANRLHLDRRRDPRSVRREYARAARELVTRCERLVSTGDAGDARAAAPVLRKAVDRVTHTLMYMDDSSGIVGADLRELMRLYAAACAVAPPKPATLAAWLVTLACDGPGWPEVVLRDFAPALGERGLAELATLVDRRAAAADPGTWGQAFPVRDLREQLAEVSGDVDRHVRVLAEHLESVDQYLRIVCALRDAGRPAEAVDWARRGLADQGASRLADPLRDTLVDLLLNSGDGDAAVAVWRTEFERRPSGATYQALLTAARRCRADSRLGGWAVEVLHDRVAREPALAATLVEILLAEGLVEQAWQVGLDHADRLPERQRVQLLDARQATHPADVIGPYRTLVAAHILDSADKRRYQRAIALLPRLRAAHQALDDAEGFTAYVAHLRTEHKRRPTFCAQLEAAGL
jgi:hypothetical protein